jgi:hypothetical protein
MKKMRILLLFFFATILNNCSGIQYFTISNTANTNPAQDYGRPSIAFKGGVVSHTEKVVGQIGNAKIEKSAQSCSYSLLWLLALGDSSIQTARKKGNIQKIALVEYEIYAYFGFFYTSFCTIVSGE